MNNRPPLQEPAGERWSEGWSNWFTQLFDCISWKKSWNYKFAIDFPSVPANSESAGLAVTIPGARAGDSVQVTPYSNTAGITHKGIVTADNTVTIYAINYTTGAINPSSMVYRVIVTQN